MARAKAPRQLSLPKFARLPGWDHDPRAHLYQTMHLLGEREDACLAALEEAEETPARLVRGQDGTWDWEGEEERLAAEEALETITKRAQDFASMVLAPVYKSWWMS